MLGAQAIDEGPAVTRLTAGADAEAVRAEQAATARRVLSEQALDLHPGARQGDPAALLAAKRWRDHMYDLLGLTQPVAAPEQADPIPADEPPAEVSTATPIRPAGDDTDWRPRGACRDEDPELHFPVGTGLTDRAQTKAAKAVCRRCPVRDQCLTWAITHRQAHGIWGGLDPDERATIKRRDTGRAVA